MAQIETDTYQTLFFSGWGTGRADAAIYDTYESEVVFTPEESMRITAIKPRVYSCSGECVYALTIKDENNNMLSELTEREASYSRFDGRLPAPVIFERGKRYHLIMHMSSNKDGIGIYTTGDAPFPNARGKGKLELITAGSGIHTLYYRGAIAFSLLGQYVQSPLEEAVAARRSSRIQRMLDRRNKRRNKRLQRRNLQL